MADMASPVQRLADPIEVTIEDGNSLSAAVFMKGRVLCGIFIPASWTTANITFQGCSTPGGTYVDVYDTSGSELTLTGAASSVYLAVDPINFYGINHLKVRSGTTGTPVNQSGDITLELMGGVPDR